mmetsp:Transcript_62543/g.152270  ORF Transcript_62543/g.152270 Transcript_62543/m.152270 type:complete len:98 (-) Transcript_62543:899-1192(-)
MLSVLRGVIVVEFDLSFRVIAPSIAHERRCLLSTRVLQTILDNHRFRSRPKPTFDDGCKKIVTPFQVEGAQGSMDRKENNFNMPYPAGLLVPFDPHL